MKLRWVCWVLAVCASTVNACDTPVFRYALEKWMPEDYSAYVFFEGELSAAGKNQIQLLKTNVNVELSEINVDALKAGFDPAPYAFQGENKTYRKSAAQKEAERLERQARFAFNKQVRDYETFGKGLSLPTLLLMSQIENQAVYQGGIHKIDSLVESPARAEVAKNILSGDSSVFVLLLTGDEQKDKTCRDALNAALRQAEAQVTLSIPENNTKLKYATPLKLKFSVVEVRRNDPAEAFFIKCLLQLPEKKDSSDGCSDRACYEPNMGALSKEVLSKNPLVVPIIGRGRAVDILNGLEINSESIHAVCQYICGECSCEIKRQNPGLDMLFAIDWDNGFIPMMGPEDEEFELYGLSNYVEPPREKNSTWVNAEPEPSEPPVEAKEKEVAETGLVKSLAAMAGVVLLTLSIGTGILFRFKNGE